MDKSKCRKLNNDIEELVKAYAVKNKLNYVISSRSYDGRSSFCRVQLTELPDLKAVKGFVDDGQYEAGLAQPGMKAWYFINGMGAFEIYEPGWYMVTIHQVRRLKYLFSFDDGVPDGKYLSRFANFRYKNPITRQPAF